MPKYRDAEIFPTSYVRLNINERKALSSRLIKDLTHRDEIQCHVAGILALSYSSGLSVKKLKSMSVSELLSENLSSLIVPVPLSESQWTPSNKNQKFLFRPTFESLELQLIAPLVDWLKKHIDPKSKDALLFKNLVKIDNFDHTLEHYIRNLR